MNGILFLYGQKDSTNRHTDQYTYIAVQRKLAMNSKFIIQKYISQDHFKSK